MPRAKDLNDKFSGVKWDGVDPDVINFRNELYEKFPHMRVTSAARNWGAGRHQKGQAIDLGYDETLHKFFYSKEGDALLRKHNLGFLDESLEENLKKTGGTGKHFHIGKDSTLKGNSYHGNTAFEREQTDHNHMENEELIDPNNVNNAYDQSQLGPNLEFLQKAYSESKQMEEQLAEQYEQEKALAARQNAIQEKLKQKLENQASLMEMVQGHDLETVSRSRSFEDGGEFEGLNDNLRFKIEALKASIPNTPYIDPENSEVAKELAKYRNESNKLLETMQMVAASSSRPVQQGEREEPTSTEENMVPQTNKSLQSTSVANKLHNKLSELGLEKHQISGIIGSLTGESGKNLSATAKNPISGAFGIAQWLGSRLVELKNFGKKLGRDFKNEDIQIEFLLHELQNTPEKKSLEAIKKAKTVEEATMIWTRKFERPSELEIQKSIAERVKNAKAFHSQIS